jgi:hypothetical protein
MVKRIAAFVALLIFSGLGSIPANANNSPASDRVDTAALPYEHIADLRSGPGESLHAFLRRIAPQLRAYSDKTGFEACGIIGTDGHGGFGVVLGSSHSHIGCANDPAREIDGMTSTGETIHSHGRQGLRIRANAADVIMMGSPIDPPRYMGGFDLMRFSDADFAHPGYLATPSGLLYQAGETAVSAVQ